MIEKIISGGQTGVDRAALDAAIEMGIPHGGSCPKGRLAEDGRIDSKYLLEETESSDYSERTKKNILNSDGTIIFVKEKPINVTDGTILTIEYLHEKEKPFLILSLSESNNFDEIIRWASENKITILNVAGPRESQAKGIYSAAFNFIKVLFDKIKQHKSKNLSI